MDETESKGEPTENEEDTSEDAEEESTASKMDEAGGNPDIEVEERSNRELATPNLEAEAELDEEGWPDLPEEEGPSSIDGLLGAAFATLFDDYSAAAEPADAAAAGVAAEDAPAAEVPMDSDAELDEAAVAEPKKKKKKKKKKKAKRSLASGFESLVDGSV
jgi:hypothetical protein